MQSGESGEDNFLAFSADKNLVVACRTKPRHKHAEVGGVVVFARGMRALSHCHHLNRAVSFFLLFNRHKGTPDQTNNPPCVWVGTSFIAV